MVTTKKKGINESGSSQYTDPTYNVLQLVNAAVERINDVSFLKAENIKEIVALNKQIMDLHVAYEEKLSVAESKRIDAIRAVDVQAVALANERAVGQASILANQVTQSADNLRNLVTSTADNLRTQVISPLIDRIALLEKAQYENKGTGQGKEQGGKNIIAVIGVIVRIAGFLITLFFALTK